MNRLTLIPFLLLSLSACDKGSDSKDRETVEAQQQQYATAQPVPTFDYSLERDVAIQLYRARNQSVATWTVWRSDLGQVEGDCASIGYPLPYDTSLTNPIKRSSYTSAAVPIEQAEPNGLYSSKNSIATWVRCLSKVNGQDVEAPIYIESKVTAYPYPVDVDYTTGRVKPVEGAEPTVTISKKGN